MKRNLDPLGRLMLQAGLVDEAGLADILSERKRALPLASITYLLGYGDEEALVRLLAKQSGIPGVVLSRSIVPLALVKKIPRELALRLTILPLREDESRIFVAVSDPLGPEELRKLPFPADKVIVPHVALHVVARRALREAYRAAEQGEQFWFGNQSQSAAEPPTGGSMRVVSDVDELPVEITSSSPVGASGELEIEGDTRSLADSMPDSWDLEGRDAAVRDPDQEQVLWAAGQTEVTTFQGIDPPLAPPDADPTGLTTGLEGEGADGPRVPSARVLIAEPNASARQRAATFLAGAGHRVVGVATGGEAIQKIKHEPFDMVLAEVGLRDVGGFAICRSIKNSQKYRHIAVLLMSAPDDEAARVDDDLLEKYAVDGYFEKPLVLAEVGRRVQELLTERKVPERPARADDNFQRVMALYRDGKTDEAIGLLRAGLAVDRLSARHHFVLANLLQRKGATYEAIDEYEATLQLKPRYFPALSRLAFLYYKQGFTSKAVDMWRRSLPVCPDPALRTNIDAFVRKVVAGMNPESGSF